MTISLSHDHVGLSVTPEDLDATIQWYTSTLGFIVDQRFDVHGQTFAFIVRDGVKIELVAGAAQPYTAVPDSIATSHTIERLHHFCVAVEDLDAIVAQVRDRGVPLIGGPMEVPVIGHCIAFITDNLGTSSSSPSRGRGGAEAATRGGAQSSAPVVRTSSHVAQRGH